MEESTYSALDLNSKRRRRPKSVDLGCVDEYEIELTRLSTQTCREINARSQERFDKNKKSKKKLKSNTANNGFFVKLEGLYSQGKKLNHVTTYPSNMCPNINNHLHNIHVLKHELPLACPTCWSLQRNSRP